ncbi:MAG: IS3 family transposase [Chloroflexi bacterium]|nr:IS3 family transposase [Chloroflexota bacterium]
MICYIDEHRGSYRVEPICRMLAIAPSTYYAGNVRPPSVRSVRDEELSRAIVDVHREHFGVYGVRKVWRALRRRGAEVGRDRVRRIMRKLGLAGVVRGKQKRTTIPAPESERPTDLVNRTFAATAPNRLWVADVMYVTTWSGFALPAFVIDAFSRRIVGWRVSASLRAELALDALEMAIWQRQSDDLTGLVHHSETVPCYPLHRTARCCPRDCLGRLPRGFVRQRPGRDCRRSAKFPTRVRHGSESY